MPGIAQGRASTLVRDRAGRLHVLEVNGIPAWRGLQGTTTVDLAERVVADFLLARWNVAEYGGFDLTELWAVDAAIADTKGNATSLTLDLFDQWQAYVKTGQYRFTPPIHVIVAFHVHSS